MKAKITKTETEGIKPQNNPVKASKRRKGRNTHGENKNPVTGLYNPLKRATGEVMPDLSDIDGLTDSIIDYIEEWTTKHKIDDMRKAEQSIFTACCIDIGKTFFKPSDILRSTELKDYGSATITNNHAYDINKVCKALEVFDYIANLYGKTFTIWAGSAFCGISDSYMYDRQDVLTVAGVGIKKKAEQSLNDIITAGKRNPTGAICILNAKHGYNTGNQGTTERIKETVVIYPKLIDIKQPREALPDVVEQ